MTTSLDVPIASQTIDYSLQQILADPSVLSVLKTYQLVPQLLRELRIDQAIAPFSCTAEEKAAIYQSFFAQQQVQPAQQQQWLDAQGLTLEEVMAPLERGLRIEKFKQVSWGHKLPSYFLHRKAELDQVIYSMIQHTDSDLITELYFQLQDGEATFPELASQYSQGLAGKTKGIMGPSELGSLHPNLAAQLQRSQPQQPVNIQIGDWYILAQIEVRIPAQLDQAMRQRLLNELYDEWLQQEVAQLQLAA